MEKTNLKSKVQNTSEFWVNKRCSNKSRMSLTSAITLLRLQIDELVMQAFRVKLTNKERKEIESFTSVLSDMHSSLNFKNKTAEPLSSKAIAANEEITNFVESPKQPETGSLVSPSPLVSWRADCTVERGKQLFLLTPLPISKTLSSRSQGTSRPAFERINDMDPPNTTIGPPPSLTISKNKNDDLLEKLELKPTPNKYPRSPVTQMEGTLGCGLITASRFLKKDHSMFLMTPCLKMSPPKSCLLLEPISESSHRVNDEFPKSTSFVVGIENCGD
ncbi:PREDICTED: uncharacterized protein LOC104592587 [Nelumbo nucifera]|uniref:Uncharacterized protein LOC104592587 n=1 Tax=Nelumbo nucifera TaxID=4432 RepID=A0A1U7ZQB7_NELNU|nr:PREDICTED: uncharacterized protein LOC104592587 [Nelumbo nucifera]